MHMVSGDSFPRFYRCSRSGSIECVYVVVCMGLYTRKGNEHAETIQCPIDDEKNNGSVSTTTGFIVCIVCQARGRNCLVPPKRKWARMGLKSFVNDLSLRLLRSCENVNFDVINI